METTSPARRSNSASSTRLCFLRTGTTRSPSRTSGGPRMRYSLPIGRLWHSSRLLTRARNGTEVSVALAPSGILDRMWFRREARVNRAVSGLCRSLRRSSVRPGRRPSSTEVSRWCFAFAGRASAPLLPGRGRGRRRHRRRSRRGAPSGKRPVWHPDRGAGLDRLRRGQRRPDIRALFAQPASSSRRAAPSSRSKSATRARPPPISSCTCLTWSASPQTRSMPLRSTRPRTPCSSGRRSRPDARRRPSPSTSSRRVAEDAVVAGERDLPRDVLELMKRLHDRGARPVLFVHGNPNTDGAAADWWRQAANVGSIVYELYFDGTRLSALGPVLGSRRVREDAWGFVAQVQGHRNRPCEAGDRARVPLRARRRHRWPTGPRAGRGMAPCREVGVALHCAGREGDRPSIDLVVGVGPTSARTIRTSSSPRVRTSGRATRSCAMRRARPGPRSTRRGRRGRSSFRRARPARSPAGRSRPPP